MAKVPPVKGTRDFYPPEMAVRNFILDGWKRISLRNGFAEYDGPIFEHLQLFTQKSGEGIVSELFSLTDRGGRDLAIRPEMTPTLARMVNQQINSLPRPIKWFSLPRCCRAERPQRGRLREFFQWNIDIIGEDSVLADAECIFTAVDYLQSVGLTPNDVVVKISSRAILAGILKAQDFSPKSTAIAYSLLDKRPKLKDDTFKAIVQEQLPQKSLQEALFRLDNVESLQQLSAICKDEDTANHVSELGDVFKYLNFMGVADYCEFDIKIVRGLAYYTGPVFEIFDKGDQLRAVGAGGRYDNLLAGLGGPQVSGTGFGMGDVVLGILLEEKGLLKTSQSSPDFYVIITGEELRDQSLQLVSELRRRDFAVTFSYKTAALGKQLKFASAANARYAVILGEETLRDGSVSVKNLATGRQTTLSPDDLLKGNSSL
ncbi:MAG: histidine--tRNA ligase [Sedimentisphaerales bacterium]|nr:histidine--tRNA ligase [Sedimentisphaerales bacterium]